MAMVGSGCTKTRRDSFTCTATADAISSTPAVGSSTRPPPRRSMGTWHEFLGRTNHFDAGIRQALLKRNSGDGSHPVPATQEMIGQAQERSHVASAGPQDEQIRPH